MASGIRASRSCIDHALVLCSILRNRKALGLNTFLSFIDFQKAFDSVDRNLLLFKLSQIGVVGKFYRAISQMYSNPRSRVILNEHKTDYFECPIGVKQGDSISATLFAIFINDLAKEIKNSSIGINLNENLNTFDQLFINVLLYADDIVLITASEDDLQTLLNIVENWCRRWRLEVNLTKTNILHVRPSRRQQSRFMFLFNNRTVEYCRTYKYLGVTLNEFLDFEITAEAQAEAAGRAVGALITKAIKNGGLPFKIYKMLYECSCTSVSDYGSEIWGYLPRDAITKIHARAARAYLGLPKNVTRDGVLAEMNWQEPVYRGQLRMVRQFLRISKLTECRLTKKIVGWDEKFSEHFNISTWFSEVKSIFNEHNILYLFNSIHEVRNDQLIAEKLKESMEIKQKFDLEARCQNKPKLRTFVTFKEFGITPNYILMPLSFIQHKFMAKLRLSSLPLRLETGRYERPTLPEAARLCKVCSDGISIENESHFIFCCTSYWDIRQMWLARLKIPPNFGQLPLSDKLKLTLNAPENVKITAQFIIDAYNVRSKILNNNVHN